MNEWEWNLLEDKAGLDHITIDGHAVRVGDVVRLRPRAGGDIFDLALRGQLASIESLEQDYEGKQHVCVVIEEDPGRDLGIMRQPGHRFFFDPEEIEPLPQQEQPARPRTAKPRILVACIGNIFLGDDGFGVEVARRLATRQLPPEVRVVDFGIRGLDLVYALQDGYEATILVDAYPSGAAPGTLSVVEPDLNQIREAGGAALEPHSMHPLNVLRMAATMNAPLDRVLLVGCEPATLGGEEGQMGLSEQVEAAVEAAVSKTEELVNRILGEITTKS